MINLSLLKTLCLFIVIFSAFSCSKKTSDPSPKPDVSAKCSGYATVGNRLFVDELNDVEKDFLDLDSIIIDLFADSINVQIKVRNIPGSMTYNHEALSVNKLNYQWSLLFDMDGNCKASAGDIELSLSKFKFDNEVGNGSIETFTQKSIWLYNGEHGAGVDGNLSHVKIENNTIHFTALHSESKKLANIKAATKVKFDTYLNDGNKIFKDAYPN